MCVDEKRDEVSSTTGEAFLDSSGEEDDAGVGLVIPKPQPTKEVPWEAPQARLDLFSPTDPPNPEKVFAKVKDMVQPAVGRTVYFCRHGESEYNVEERIGGDPDLTSRGRSFAVALGDYINNQRIAGLHIWTSSLKRTIATAAFVSGPRSQTRLLDELESGLMDSLTYKEVQELHNEEWRKRDRDKLGYRYPAGESYVDCCCRVASVLVEMEKHDNLLVVAHQAILRCIFGYLQNKTEEEIPFINIPQHTLLEVTFDGEENLVSFQRLAGDHVEMGVTVASQDNVVTSTSGHQGNGHSSTTPV